MRLRTIVPVLFALATAAACGSDPVQPTGAPSTLSFTYSGYRTGSYSVTGFLPDVRTGTRWTTEWASAGNFATPDSSYTGITASLPSTNGNHLLEIVIPFGVKGTFPLSAQHFDELVFDYKSGVSAGEVYTFIPGTVTVTSSTADRVAGTFSGTAVDTVNHRTINVTGGVFDVHIDQP